MKQTKLLFVITVVFTILSTIITSLLIKSNSNNLNTQNLTEDNNTSLDNLTNDEQTIDIYATYDQNDLLINQITEMYNEIEITIPQIEGLKDKDIESKINNEMRTRIFEKIKI